MQFKLVDLYHTKYFYKSLLLDMNYLFSNIRRLSNGEQFQPNIGGEELGKLYAALSAGEEVIIDLACARLTSDAGAAVITAQRNGVKFCDSADKDRNRILATNVERLVISKEAFVPLPKFDYHTDVKQYIASLDAGTTYMVTGMPEKIMIALTCLITMIRPGVSLCVDVCQRNLFKFIATKVSYTGLLNDDEFYMITDYGVEETRGDGYVYVQELQEAVPVKEALHYGIILPKKFGRVVLLHDNDWSPLFKASLSILEEYQNSCPKCLSELYGE